jgi:hypothetical protein
MSKEYWTSSSYVGNAYNAWSVNMDNGSASNLNKTGYYFYVWPVRGGQSWKTLSVAKSGAGGGTLTSSIGGINCGSICSASITSGVIVPLNAAPDSGSVFSGWLGACSGTGTCEVTMDAAKSVTATFSIAPTNGTCGSSNGMTMTTAPSTNFCTTGTASTVTGTGPWGWTCTGSNGGTTANCNASISTSTPTQFIVSPTTGSDYTITPSVPQTINNNGTTSFTVTPASGYGIASVNGCGGSLSDTTYTTGAITANCTISVTAVARNAGSGGATQPPTITDALKVLLAVVGTTPLTAADQIRYDVAPLGSSGTPVGNGSIDAADVILILRRSIGIGSW